MRKFGTDKPEFMAFTLGDAKKVYKIPLAASMPADAILKLQEAYNEGAAAAFRYQLDLLRKYMGDAVEKLTAGDISDIYKAWEEESGTQGAEPGES